MKKIFRFLLAGLMLAGVFVSVGVKTLAYDPSYLTKEIPTGYYDNLDMSKTDESFRRDLSAIISAGYKKYSYDGVKAIIQKADEDPKNPGKQVGFYSGDAITIGTWNREHVWAKSHGFSTSSWAPYSDAHHLRPTYVKINSARGNSDFGELPNSSADQYGNKWTSSIFEPRDEVKGDVARIMFYMATRYGFEAPYNLKLVEEAPTPISKTGNGRFGNLSTLIKWHYQDPVSDSEIYRNNVIYEYQNNRNPYIDHPEFVDNAYPSEYSKQEVDQAKVDNVIGLITALPAVITLEQKAQVNAAKAAYDALNFSEKKLVTNYNILQVAIQTIFNLENPDVPIEPEEPTDGDVVVDFKNHGLSNRTYAINQTLTIGGREFFASGAGIYDKELRLGTNNSVSTPPIDSKYGVPVTSGVVLEAKFDTENAKSLKIDIDGKYGTINHWYIAFKESTASSYSLVADGAITSIPTSISASLPAAKTGRFVFIFTGSYPRVVLSSYKVTTEAKSEINYKDYTTDTSILAVVENDTLVDAGLRFGGRYDKELFADATSFGVVILETSDLDGNSIESLYESGSIDDFIATLSAGNYKNTHHNFMNDKAVVNADGTLNTNGQFYQFGFVVDNVIGQASVSLTAVVYVEIDGKVYFFEQISMSFEDAIDVARDIEGITEEELALLAVIESLI